jgi:hypothetical protein
VILYLFLSILEILFITFNQEILMPSEKIEEGSTGISSEEVVPFQLKSHIYRINSIFVLLVMFMFSIFVPIQGLVMGITAPTVAWMDITLGVVYCSVLFLGVLCAKNWFGAFIQIANSALFMFAFAGDVLFYVEHLRGGFPTIIIFLWVINAFVLIGLVIGLLDFLITLVKFIRTLIAGKHSKILWNPKIVKSFMVVVLCCVPYLVMLTPIYQPKVTLTFDEKFDSRFTFWPGKGYFPPEVRKELNDHGCHMEISGPIVNGTMGGSRTNLTALQLMEQELPNVTYRFKIGGAVTQKLETIMSIDSIIRNDGLILIQAKENGTIKNFRGFICNVEGSVEPIPNITEYQESSAILSKLFTDMRNRAPWMDIASTPEIDYVTDQYFDGDADQHILRTMPGFMPDGWTTFVPMHYRCFYGGNPPYGVPAAGDTQYPSAYHTYTQLYRYKASVPEDLQERKLSILLGITNCTCFGQDVTVNDNGATNGFQNLILETRICKAFGMREIGFFLIGSAGSGDGYIMGDPFEAYGIDFLDKLNASVNGLSSYDPIVLTHDTYSTVEPSATGSWYQQQDFLYNFDRWPYILLMCGIVCCSVLIHFGLLRLKRKE